MPDVEIVALRCLSCGNPRNVPEKELRYGCQFICSYCGTVSRLIVGRQLYIPQPGEHVCVKCGQVAPRDARFCQCGASLVRKCINPKCLKEFPVDHDICDYCGWPQDVEPSSKAGVRLQVQRAIRDLSDRDPRVVLAACEALEGIGPAASEAVPALVDLLKSGESDLDKEPACEALVAIGPASVPALVDLIRSSKRLGDAYYACKALERIGEPALPALRSLTGWFSGVPGEVKWRVRKAIAKIERGEGEPSGG